MKLGALKHKRTTLSHLATRYIRLYLREARWSVCEYPRSGGTWLAGMLSDYLDLPFIRSSSRPIVQPSVVRAHWRHSSRLTNTIYMIRDGRDAMVSLYFHALNHPHAWAHLEKALGPGFRSAGPRQNMTRFVEYHMENPRSSSFLNWNDHVFNWADRANVTYARYELLHGHAIAHFTEVLESASIEVDPARVRRAVDVYSFEKMAGGRSRGEEDVSSFYRKGIVGDWTNYFTKETAQAFDHYARDALMLLGYENDSGWVDAYTYA